MQAIDLLSRAQVQADLAVPSKKRLFEHLARLLAADQGAEVERHVFEALFARERQGSTGLDHGVAVPHGRVRGEIPAAAAFVRLKQPLDFDAFDGQPVDLVFALVVPERFTDEHLQLLAQIAGMFADAEQCRRLRAAPDGQALYQSLVDWFVSRS